MGELLTQLTMGSGRRAITPEITPEITKAKAG
jgi:hypothetical protein